MPRFKAPLSTPLLLAALGIPFVAACDEDPIEPHEHAEVASIRLTVGTQNVNITEGGAQGSLTIPNGASTLAITYFDEEGDAIPLDEEFELSIESDNTGVLTVAMASSAAGTLTGVADGTTVLEVCILHEDHCDFGEFDVNVTVQ